MVFLLRNLYKIQPGMSGRRMIRCRSAWAACASRYLGGSIKDLPETPQTSMRYDTDVLKGSPQLGAHNTEKPIPLGPTIKIIPVWYMKLYYKFSKIRLNGSHIILMRTRSPKQLSAAENMKTTINWLENIRNMKLYRSFLFQVKKHLPWTCCC